MLLVVLIHTRGILWIVLRFIVDIECARLWVQNKMEQNSLYGLAFAILFLQAWHAVEIKRPELVIKSPPWPNFQKKIVRIGWLDKKKLNFYLIKDIFLIKDGLILLGIVTFFHVKHSGFGIIEWCLSYTGNYMKKWQKFSLTRYALVSKLIKILASRFNTTLLKPMSNLWWHF